MARSPLLAVAAGGKDADKQQEALRREADSRPPLSNPELDKPALNRPARHRLKKRRLQVAPQADLAAVSVVVFVPSNRESIAW